MLLQRKIYLNLFVLLEVLLNKILLCYVTLQSRDMCIHIKDLECLIKFYKLLKKICYQLPKRRSLIKFSRKRERMRERVLKFKTFKLIFIYSKILVLHQLTYNITSGRYYYFLQKFLIPRGMHFWYGNIFIF